MGNRFKNHLLVTDMDGTLLTDQKTVMEMDRQALNYWVKEGGLFAIATGRSKMSLANHLGDLPVNLPSILYNGAVLYDYQQQKPLWYSRLPENYKEVIREVKYLEPEIGIEILGIDKTYLYQENEIVLAHMGREQIPFIAVAPDEAPDQAIKVLFGVPEDKIDTFAHKMQEKQIPGLTFVKTHSVYFEMLPFGVNKGRAVREMKQLLGLEHYFTISVGDFFNDIEMIQDAHLGVATENALDQVKKLADAVVCTNNQGAIAETIHLVDGRLED